MLSSIKKFLGFGPAPVAPTEASAPYKVETPAPVVASPAEDLYTRAPAAEQPAAAAPVIAETSDPVSKLKKASAAKPAAKRTKKNANPATE